MKILLTCLRTGFRRLPPCHRRPQCPGRRQSPQGVSRRCLRCLHRRLRRVRPLPEPKQQPLTPVLVPQRLNGPAEVDHEDYTTRVGRKGHRQWCCSNANPRWSVNVQWREQKCLARGAKGRCSLMRTKDSYDACCSCNKGSHSNAVVDELPNPPPGLLQCQIAFLHRVSYLMPPTN